MIEDKEEWLSFSEVCQRWGKNKHTVAKFVIDGKLRAYNNEYQLIWVTSDETFVLSPFNFPESYKLSTGDDAKLSVFRKIDVVEFERGNGITPHVPQVAGHYARLAKIDADKTEDDIGKAIESADPITVISEPLQISTEHDTQEGNKNFFHHEGTGWRIGFQGEKGIFRDYKYIRYISMLLEKPGKPITALDLFHAADTNDHRYENMSREQALDEGLSFAVTYKDDEVSTKQCKEFEKLISDIKNETDPLIKSELEVEWARKISELKKMNAIVVDGKPAKPSRKQRIDDPHSKKAQKAVSKGLEAAYKAFEKSKMKQLAKHLRKYIRPAGDYDFQCFDAETHWDIKL